MLRRENDKFQEVKYEPLDKKAETASFLDKVKTKLAVPEYTGVIGFVTGMFVNVFNAAPTIATVRTIGEPILGFLGAAGPLALATLGLKTMIELYQTYRDKTLGQRKTRYLAGFTSLGILGMAMAVVLGAFAVTLAPIVLPSLFTGLVIVGLIKEREIIKADEAKLQAQKNSIEINETILTGLKDPEARAEVAKELRQQRYEAAKLEIQLDAMQSARKINIASLFGVGFMVAGAFAWPLLLVGGVLFLTTMVLNTRAASKTKKKLEELQHTFEKGQNDMDLNLGIERMKIADRSFNRHPRSESTTSLVESLSGQSSKPAIKETQQPAEVPERFVSPDSPSINASRLFKPGHEEQLKEKDMKVESPRLG